MIRLLGLYGIVTFVAMSAGCTVRDTPVDGTLDRAGIPDPTLEAEVFRAALEHVLTREGTLRVDPRLLMGWRDRGPHMSESPRELVDRRREILTELGIPETDAEHNNRCPLNPWATDYTGCSEQGTFYGYAIGVPGKEPDGEFCRRSADQRCVVEVLNQMITERGAARSFDHYWFGWDASWNRWVLEETINQHTT